MVPYENESTKLHPVTIVCNPNAVTGPDRTQSVILVLYNDHVVVS